jgi:mRNA interferase MazF
MVTRYTPSRGDVIWLDFSPQAGHEQAGRRPALVLSPQAYNKKQVRLLFVPLIARLRAILLKLSCQWV